MSHDHHLREHRKAIEDALAFFSPERKRDRENWVVDTFLKNLGVVFSPSELKAVTNEPPDIRFRDANFEVKEVLDPGRRRHKEYRDALLKAQKATALADLLEPFTPQDTTISEIYTKVLEAARCLLRKYSRTTCTNLDLLFYLNFQDVMRLVEVPFPDVEALRLQPWRSVSFIMGQCSCVLVAQLNAPAFLRVAKEKIIHRAITSV